MENNLNEELPWKTSTIELPELVIEEDESLFTDSNEKGISTFWGGKPVHNPTVIREVELTANHVIQFEGAVHANAGSLGKGYDIGFSIFRQPNLTHLPNRHLSQIKQTDEIHFAIWCSLPGRGWYSDRFRTTYGAGQQTPWIPMGNRGTELTASVVWVPPQGYNPSNTTVVHCLLLRRLSPGLEEIFLWRTGPGAPFPYTNNQNLKPATPQEDHLAASLRRVYKISPTNSRGLEMWGRPLYRQPL
jgi:hypothetical protein